MILYKNGNRINIPQGTWDRLSPSQRKEYTATADGGEITSDMIIETIKTTGTPVIKKNVKVDAPVVAEIEDDITGNKIEPIPEISKPKPIHKGGRKKK